MRGSVVGRIDSPLIVERRTSERREYLPVLGKTAIDLSRIVAAELHTSTTDSKVRVEEDNVKVWDTELSHGLYPERVQDDDSIMSLVLVVA